MSETSMTISGTWTHYVWDIASRCGDVDDDVWDIVNHAADMVVFDQHITRDVQREALTLKVKEGDSAEMVHPQPADWRPLKLRGRTVPCSLFLRGHEQRNHQASVFLCDWGLQGVLSSRPCNIRFDGDYELFVGGQ